MPMLIWSLRRKITFMLIPLSIFLGVFYFAYHAIQGERGILGWIKITQKCQVAEHTLEGLTAEKEALEKKIFLMGDQIDSDLLEQQVRSLLGYVHPDEIIVRFKECD